MKTGMLERIGRHIHAAMSRVALAVRRGLRRHEPEDEDERDSEQPRRDTTTLLRNLPRK